MARELSESEIADFRERLRDAAERLFAEHGPEGVSMRRLADELGCSPMTPYRYFRDKGEILAAVRANGFDRFAEAMEIAHAKPGDPMARAEAVGAAYLDFALENPNAYRLMFDFDQPGEEVYPDLARAATRAQRTMSGYLKTLLEAGLIEGDPDRLGYVFWAALHGAVVLQLARKLPATVDAASLGMEAVRLLMRGLRPPG